MKILHILKTEPDSETQTLMDLISEGEETTQFALYQGSPDYEALIDLIFENEKVISWW
jgi:hypothetical protein